MKKKLLTALVLIVVSVPAFAQLDVEGKTELNRRKQKAKENNTVLWMYDTLYKKGEPYCLLESRVQSEEGNEYIVKGLEAKDLIYIIEPSNIEKLLSKVTLDANVEFSFLNEKQKLNVPKKSVTSLPDFIVKNNLIIHNNGNMGAVKKLLFIHSEQNKQGYTGNIPVDSIETNSPPTPELAPVKEDTTRYQPVVRNKNAPIEINNYIIRQNGVIIGRYNKTNVNEGVTENNTRFIIKSPDWKDIISITNGGFGSSNWNIEILTTGKKDSYNTSSPVHSVALKQIITFLVNNNHL